MTKDEPPMPTAPIFIPIWAPHDARTTANLAVYLLHRGQPPADTVREWLAGYTPHGAQA